MEAGVNMVDVLSDPPRLCNASLGEYPGTNNCVNAYYLTVENSYQTHINGYIMPILVIITVITNILICAVLLRKNMRSPTNTILVAMAAADMLTGVWTLPCYIYFYTMGAHKEFVPYSWCVVYYWLTDYLPTVFHTASVWLTVALAAQRYIFVCHNVSCKHLFTVSNMVKVVVGIYVASFAYQSARFAEYNYGKLELNSNVDPEVMVTGCYYDFRPFLARHMILYFSIYFWFRVIFIHIAPCVCLALLNALLARAMHLANLRMEQLLRQNRRAECRRLEETNATTMMLVVVVAISFLVEFPIAVYFITMFIENTFNTILVDLSTRAMLELFTNMFLLFSYPFNFFIYCVMSRQFRETFKALCGDEVIATFNSKQQSVYDSFPVENGNKEAADV